MIKVECVSCKSPYDVDERRIPEKGMKMRCPKCSTSFMVARDGTVSAVPLAGARAPLAPALGAAPPPSAAEKSAPPTAARSAPPQHSTSARSAPPIAAPPAAKSAPPLAAAKAAAPHLKPAAVSSKKSATIVSPAIPAPSSPPTAAGSAAKDFSEGPSTEPITPQVAAASLLNPGPILQPKAAAQPKLADSPSAFNKTLISASSSSTATPAAPKAAALGNILANNAPANAANQAAQKTKPASEDSGADLPAVKPAARPAVPWGSLAPPSMDSKPQAARPMGSGALPKGASGAAAPPSAAAASLKSSAGSAFGASAKQTLLGAARSNAAIEAKPQPMAAEPNLELDLPAPTDEELPLIDLPAAKPVTDNSAFAPKTAKTAPVAKKPIAPDLPLVDLPAAKSATPLGQPNMSRPANSILPEAEFSLSGADDPLADLPAPRAQKPGMAFGARHNAAAASKPTAEQPIVDLPAPTDVDLPLPKTSRTAVGGFVPATPAKKGTAPQPQAAAPSEPAIDLPAPKLQPPAAFRKPPAAEPPKPAAARAPVPKAQPSSIDFALDGLEGPGADETDLPVLSGSGAKREVDLPALREGGAGAGHGNDKRRGDMAARRHVDLPALKPAMQDFEVDLPGLIDSPITDLPAALGDIDLPTPKHNPSYSEGFGNIDLPTPKGVVDLPTPVGTSDLPTPKGFTDLPVPKGEDGFGMLDLPVPRNQDEASFGDLELPELPVRAGFGDAELPMPHAHSDRARGSGLRDDESSFGDLDLSGPELPEDSFAEVRSDDLVRVKMGQIQPTSTPPALQNEGLGEGEAYGEAGIGEEPEEDMEFGIASGDDTENLGLPPELLRRNKGEATQADEAARGKRALRLLIGLAAVLVLLGASGAALGFTDYGFFGMYYLEQFLPEAADGRFAHEAIARAEKTASTDTYRDVQRALALLGESRHKAGLNRELLTRSLLHESLFDLRFGSQASSASHSAAILARLEERHGRAPGMALGRAADAARRGDLGEARRQLDLARPEANDDAYFSLLEGEVSLHENKLAEADKAFAHALKQGGSARAQWGLARVALLRTDVGLQRNSVEDTLKLSPEHVEARLALARLLWNAGKQNEAEVELNRALGREKVSDHFLWSSKAARAGSYSMLGYVHESRGHLSLARKAYDEALAADPYLLEALLGAGRVLLRERRWNDALARFESALNLAQKSNGGLVLSGRRADVEARLGQSHAQLSLNRASEARATLGELMKDNPNDAEIVRAAGQADDVLGNQTSAEELLIKSVELSPNNFASYLALAQHYFKQGRADKASETLNEASTKVEENVEMRRMLGQSELARGRYDSAVHEFQRATELDPDDLDAQFGLATAYRRTNELDKARTLLDAIAKHDAQFAGLALERGLLLEAQGKWEEAVQAYRAAHTKDPSDSALNLRLGAAQVEAGQLEDAELTLQTVMRETPNSAEAEYFSGRLALARGRGPDALTHFDRALSLDGTQAVYHLYAARAALDMGNLGRTLDEAEATLGRDPGMGDAYWVRGIVRMRSGAVKDALKDAKRALDLNPMRVDAYALMAECYDELRQLGDAAQSYRVALSKDPKRGEWWYKFGRLSMDRGSRGDAHEALEKARELGDKVDPPPYWLADAYRLSGEVARGMGDRKQAVVLFRRYLSIAPDGALDRDDVRKLLMSWEVEVNP